jgi:hypothetical protein
MNRETAIKLAESGLFVFPCDDKQPAGDRRLGSDGFKWREYCTNDPGEVSAMWHWFGRDCQVALDCGKSGLVVVDLDRKNGKDGVTVFDRWLDEYGADLSACPVVETPSGGYHVLFRQPEGNVIGCPVTFKPLGIDIKGIGGYVMALDTVLSDGTYYELAQGILSNAPPLFPWLVDMIQDGRQDTAGTDTAPMGSPLLPSGRRVITDVAYSDERADAYMQTLFDTLVTPLATCPDGMRNDALNSVVFRLSGTLANATIARSMYRQADIYAFAQQACFSNGCLPKERKLFDGTFRSAWRGGQMKPCRFPLPDPPDPFGGQEISFKSKGEAA